MMFGPDWGALVKPIAATIPFAFLLFMLGFWLGNKMVGERRSKMHNALAALLQWCLVIPLQLVLGHQLSLWIPEATEASWIAILTAGVPLAGIIAAYFVLRHKPKHALVVGLISSVFGMVASMAVLWVLLKLI